MEKKYRYRPGPSKNTGKSVPKLYWDIRKEDPVSAQKHLGGKGFVAKKEGSSWFIFEQGEPIENDCIADVYNTILKIAKKRSFVDATLTATAASDIFTQDLEELNEYTIIDDRPAPIKHPEPTEADGGIVLPDSAVLPESTESFTAPPLTQSESVSEQQESLQFQQVISEAQGRRLFAIWKQSGKTDGERKKIMESFGFKSSKDITRDKYEVICDAIQKPTRQPGEEE
jgi:hypothetical protein